MKINYLLSKILSNKLIQSNKYLQLRWELVLLLLKLTGLSHQSIAGVTYMDNFDFEDRYRNVYECDPFHWHPLHLPEHCAEMYENLIRSRIATHGPVRVVREREQPNTLIYSLNPNFGYPAFDIPTYVYRKANTEVMDSYKYEKIPMSPYDKMLDLLRKDVERNPSAPSIGMMPNIGPVAVYRQPISKKSENMIKKISGAYAKAGRKNSGEEYYGKIEIDGAPNIEVETTTADEYGSPRNKNKPKKKKPEIITLQG